MFSEPAIKKAKGNKGKENPAKPKENLIFELPIEKAKGYKGKGNSAKPKGKFWFLGTALRKQRETKEKKTQQNLRKKTGF